MSWLSGLREPQGTTYFRVNEIRFTQTSMRLQAVAVSLSTHTQRFNSRLAQPLPVDPVSHRYRVQWADSEISMPIKPDDMLVTIVVTNRRRRFRTVIGTATLDLALVRPPGNGNRPIDRTVALETTLFPALNVKIDFHVEFNGISSDTWRRIDSSEARVRARSSSTTLGPAASMPGSGSAALAGAASGAAPARSPSPSLRPSLTPSQSPRIAFPAYHPPPSAYADSDLLRPSPPACESLLGPAASSRLSLLSDKSSLRSTSRSVQSQPSTRSQQSVQSQPSTRSQPSMLSQPSVQSSASQPTSIGMPRRDSSLHGRGFGFSINSDTLGVVFMDIVSIANLPQFRSLTGLSFDMDPFVVVSFGRRVYKTPYRRHTLNPTFNCKVPFDVRAPEANFAIVFTVWDQDKITLNDRVAEVQLPVAQVIKDDAPRLDPDTGLYDLDTHAPSTRVLPLVHESGESEMLIKIHYYPVAAIRQQMWRGVIGLYDRKSEGAMSLSLSELRAMLNSLGSTLTDDTVRSFFTRHDLDPGRDRLKEDLVVLELERLVTAGPPDERVILFRVCPICHKPNHGSRRTAALDHLSLCASRQWYESDSVLLDKKYVSSQQASKRWYSKFLSKFSYGSYQIGANSANILVQDRITGQVSEEKMSMHVRVAIRAIYSLGPVERHRFQRLLKKYTLRQGIRYSSPSSAASIEPFIAFHRLDMSDVARPVASFSTFNEFFCRELRPGARPCENVDEPRTAVSAADCRLTVFKTLTDATRFWIKGKQFSIQRLIGDAYPEDVSRYSTDGSLLIFRLAPQDYHRVHSPVDGVVGEARHIEGHYYTVNPMAVRSHLDVFGENARTVIPIDSPQFGRVMVVMVGAMMVGSCVVTAQPGNEVKRTDELGYFQFGGSTVVALFEKSRIELDSDLVANSSLRIETLVKVGMSVGHDSRIGEYVRSYDTRMTTIRRGRSLISGGGSYLPFSLD